MNRIVNLVSEIVEIDTTENGFVLTPEMLEKAILEQGDKLRRLFSTIQPTDRNYLQSGTIEAFGSCFTQVRNFVVCDEVYSELTYYR